MKIKFNLFSFVLGLVLMASIGVGATLFYKANEIEFVPTDSSWNVTNVEEAINHLYEIEGKVLIKYTYSGNGEKPNVFPNKNSGYIVDKVSCRGANASWDNINWKMIMEEITGSSIECELNLIDVPKDYSWNFKSKDEYQEFIVPVDGIYRIELWGAQGGSTSKEGGYGSYTKGDIKLNKNTNLFFYVGSEASTWNGGGTGSNHLYLHGVGGGATDVRIVSGEWNNFDSLKSRIMVAAGGGGAETWGNQSYGGAGGGLYSYDVPYCATGSWNTTLNTGATQNKGGSGFYCSVATERNGFNGGFGYGGKAYVNYGGGGGSGYFGGGGGGDGGPMTSAGAGGSSFISGHYGCNAIDKSSTSSSIVISNQNIHYSNYYFENTEMIDGLGFNWNQDSKYPSYSTNSSGSHVSISNSTYITGMPTHDGSKTMIGNTGNGYAKITLISID